MMTWNSLMFNSPSSYMMEVISIMHDYLVMILISVLLVVLVNLVYSFSSNFFELKFYENHELETVWTVIPFLILSFIIVPSITTLYLLDSCLFCGFSISIVGHQWYWSYFYKDLDNISFDSYMVPSSESHIRLLDVDNRLIIPTNLPVRFSVTSADVIHSWTIPSFGVKMDAVPGRLNQFCFSSKRSGVFFGQCSEICGANHSFMPIVLESLKFSDFLKLF